MKKITVFLLLVCLMLMLAVPVLGIGSKVVDQAGLLTDGEEALLEEKAQEIVSQYDMDVVILTVDSTDGQYIRDFADDFYDNNGYGIGSDYSGVLFMLAMDTREWYISTCGDGIYAVTDYGVQMLFSQAAGYLANDDYFTAFDVYLDELKEYYAAFTLGDPVDGFAPEYEGPGSYEPDYSGDIIYYEKPSRGVGSILFTSVLIGAAANILLDPLFIFILHMGVRGAALATIISQALSCTWVVGFLCSKKTRLRLKKGNLGLQAGIILLVLRHLPMHLTGHRFAKEALTWLGRRLFVFSFEQQLARTRGLFFHSDALFSGCSSSQRAYSISISRSAMAAIRQADRTISRTSRITAIPMTIIMRFPPESFRTVWLS